MNLDFFLRDLKPVLVFLSEPQTFQSDISTLVTPFLGSYSFYLNSDDLYCHDLPMITKQASGGTMALWQTSLDPYVKTLATTSSAVLPLLLSVPGLAISAHVGVYLPTAGKDPEFVSALSELESVVQSISEEYSCPIYIRGDCNVNKNNKNRAKLFRHFLSKYKFSSLDLDHTTYHHFTGNGSSDSQLDLLLYLGPPGQAESCNSVICGKENPLVRSLHDLIVSSFPLPRCEVEPSSGNVTAPRVPNKRVKVLWSEKKQPLYESMVSPLLTSLRERWGSSSGSGATSVLLSSTNDALNLAAQATQKFVSLAKPPNPRPTTHPEVREAQLAALASARHLRLLSSASQPDPASLLQARETHQQTRAELQRLSRSVESAAAAARDEKLFSICSGDSSSIFKSLRSLKSSSSAATIQRLTVGDKTYVGEHVPDGFFDSLSSLKCPNMSYIHDSPSYSRFNLDYEMVVKICQSGIKIPKISESKGRDLLRSLKADVNDLFSITARHYLNAGSEGAKHFTFLLNHIISNVNLSSLDILNSVWAIILFKGHGKDKESERSYRFISTCPFLSKALDSYVGELCESGWTAAQAETQFQGTGSCHELAALLLTETINFSIFSLLLPIFCIFLDAKSAFDKILIELCIRAAFLACSENGQEPGQEIIYLNNRLKNRQTFTEYSKTLMGPIFDRLGVEQGGINSDKLYRLANCPELTVTQRSRLGVLMGAIHVASVGQADDIALCSNTPHGLQGLLHLAMEIADDYHIEKVAEKTKLLCFTPRGQNQATSYWKDVSPINMSGKIIPFVEQAEHVGIIRSTEAGNMASVLDRMTAHRRAVFAVLPAGLARGHRGSPAASLKVEKMYGLPVLLSGLASLVLSKTEQDTIDLNYKKHLEKLQRLYPCTPAPVVYFLAGSLPASAKLHLRQLSLLGMIARMGHSSLLHQHGSYVLARPSLSPSCYSFSWFFQVRGLCERYGLPDPLFVLSYPDNKHQWKSCVKRQVLEHWGGRLRDHAAGLDSLEMFRASHMSLSKPSAIWTSCGSSGYEIKKATTQARMLSGRYRSCWLRRHFGQGESGMCRVPGCTGTTPGTLLHLVTGQCPGLASSVAKATTHWAQFVLLHPVLDPILQEYARSEPGTFLAFLLDPSTQPPVLALAQEQGHGVIDQLCHLARTWVFLLHRERLQLLGVWDK